MRFQCHIGTGFQVRTPPVIQPAAVPRAVPAKQSSWRQRTLPGYGAVAGGVLLAMVGCASIDSKMMKAWSVEPVLTVTHSAESSRAYYAMGRYLDGSLAWDKAIDAYRKSIAADAHNVEARNALGVALAQTGRLADAETALRQALVLAPDLAHVRSNLGYVLLLAGKSDEAVTQLKAALARDRNNATARANLREALARSDALPHHATTAATAPVTPPEVVASVRAPEAVESTPGSGTGSEGVENESVPMTISVPLPITAVELPRPLAASTTAPMTLRVVTTPTVPSLSERVAGADGVRPAAHVDPGTSSTVRPAAPERGLRLEVSNGNGVAGMAARVGRWLTAQGTPVDRLSNQPRFAQQRTTIQYGHGHEEVALHIARSLPATAKADALPTRGLRSDVRVVLGHDWVQTAACLDHPSCSAGMVVLKVAANP
jgi:Flp pilus assembly protein TadD